MIKELIIHVLYFSHKGANMIMKESQLFLETQFLNNDFRGLLAYFFKI